MSVGTVYGVGSVVNGPTVRTKGKGKPVKT